jgi:hypothetical protein
VADEHAVDVSYRIERTRLAIERDTEITRSWHRIARGYDRSRWDG